MTEAKTVPGSHMTKSTPQSTLFNDVFIAYLFMNRLPRTAIKDKP